MHRLNPNTSFVRPSLSPRKSKTTPPAKSHVKKQKPKKKKTHTHDYSLPFHFHRFRRIYFPHIFSISRIPSILLTNPCLLLQFLFPYFLSLSIHPSPAAVTETRFFISCTQKRPTPFFPSFVPNTPSFSLLRYFHEEFPHAV